MLKLKPMRYLLIIILFASCVNQKKVTRWLDENEVEAAKYCADEFPVKESVDTTYKIDSAAYNEAYNELLKYVDSLLGVVESKPTERLVYITTEGRIREINMDSLRKAVTAQVKKAIRPCIDSIKYVTKVVENTARVRQLTLELGTKDQTISKRDQTISDQAKTIKQKARWVWYFWLLIALIAGYVFVKIRFKLPI